MTEQRRVILEELSKVTTHPTAGELYEMVRVRLPHISLGTVYRNLEDMARAGDVTKLGQCDASNRFDADVSTHYHVTCRVCGRVDDVLDLPSAPFSAPPARLSGYEVTGHRLEFFGVCPGCQGSQQRKGADYGQHQGN